MPRPAKGPRLYLRAARRRGSALSPAVWVIRDGGAEISTGCDGSDRAGAEQALAAHIVAKWRPARRERDIAEIAVADVIAIYLADVSPRQSRPAKAAERAGRLNAFFGDKTLSEINGPLCRAYVVWRGSNGGARRDLEDLSAAIGHHSVEGLHRGQVRVWLPPKGEPRQRWLTRDEVKRLARVCFTTRESQEGEPTRRKPLEHTGRFVLIGALTGSRPGAILNASWLPGPGRSYVDIENGVFHRRGDGVAKTAKRQPTVKLPGLLLGLMRRWRRDDLAKTPPQTYVVSFAGEKIESVDKSLARAVKLAGLADGVTPYTLRHTCASWLVAKGLPTRLIADFLGTSEQMILQHYGHLAKDYQNAAAKAIARR